ncbi:hypothetical protein MC885_017319 [Smutsia gigantea]|nr:hypothetical protein MC885_017319 [Smutsia gigantea]
MAIHPQLLTQKDVMGIWKFSPFLALRILILAALESPSNPATFSEEKSCHLLAALVKDYVRMKAQELGQETEGSSLDIPRAKQCRNLSTCVLSTYTQDLYKFRTFPQTATGVRVPGKKRVMAIGLERDHGPHLGMLQDAY